MSERIKMKQKKHADLTFTGCYIRLRLVFNHLLCPGFHWKGSTTLSLFLLEMYNKLMDTILGLTPEALQCGRIYYMV